MGLVFKKFAENAYCPKCKKRYIAEVTNQIDEYCPSCNKPLVGSANFLQYPDPGDIRYFYLLRSTDIRIPENSILAKLVVVWPSMLLGVIGLIPFLLFLITALFEGITSAYHAVVESFLTIYGDSSYVIPSTGATSVLSRIFENDLVVYGILLLSVYFAVRVFLSVFYVAYYTIKGKSSK